MAYPNNNYENVVSETRKKTSLSLNGADVEVNVFSFLKNCANCDKYILMYLLVIIYNLLRFIIIGLSKLIYKF